MLVHQRVSQNLSSRPLCIGNGISSIVLIATVAEAIVDLQFDPGFLTSTPQLVLSHRVTARPRPSGHGTVPWIRLAINGRVSVNWRGWELLNCCSLAILRDSRT